MVVVFVIVAVVVVEVVARTVAVLGLVGVLVEVAALGGEVVVAGFSALAAAGSGSGAFWKLFAVAWLLV